MSVVADVLPEADHHDGADGPHDGSQDGGFETRQDGGHDGSYEARSNDGGHDGGHDASHDGGHDGADDGGQTMAVDAPEHAHAAHHPDGHTHHAHHEQQHHEHDAGVGHDGEDPHGGHVGGHEGHEGGHEEVTDGGDGVHDAAGHVVEGAQDHGDYIQLTVKIGDHEVNGGTRYRAWIEHRDAVMQRLRGWELVATGPDFATFNIPQGIAQAAANERASKLPKFERKYWGDKTDFCRCLEAILWEMEKGRKPPRMRRQLLAPGESALAQGVGFQRDQRPRPSVQSLAAGMQTHGSMAFASGVDSVDMLVRLLESKDPGELMGYERRIRMLCNKLEMQMHTRELQMQLPIKNHDLPKEWSPLVELPLPPSAPQTVKRGSAKIQRSMMPVRLSMQMEEMQQKFSELIDSLQQGFLDPKALGVKSHHESNPAHVGALLKTGLAIMGKESGEDAMEHWMCVPRPRLIQIYIDEFSRIIKSITDQAHQHAQMSPPGPLAKYAQIEPSTYAVQASKERLGDRILHCLNIMVVPIVDKSCTPPQVTKGVMSNPVGMPDDYLIRYLDMLYKNVAYGEREQGGGSLLGEPQEYEILRATLPKDAVPLVEALICAYGGEEERTRLGIPIRRKTAAIERVQKVRQDLEMLAKSADAHIATSNSKSPHSAREYHIRAKAKQLGIWLDPSKRTTAADRRRPRLEEHDAKELEGLSGYRSDNWEADDVGLGGLAFTGHPGPAGGGHARGRPINAISIHRLTGLGDTSGRMTMEEVEARIQSDPRGSIQVVVKIGDHEQNGNFRYKAWAMHRDIVMQRLRWDVVEENGDYVTFSVPAAIADAAKAEREAKLHKEERRFFGDKTDFCRCLEVVINEVRGIKQRPPRPASLGPEMLQAREQMMVTTEYKTKLAKLREMQAQVREGSATAERYRQEEEELAAKHTQEMERINIKYGGSLRSAKRKRASTATDKLRKKAKKMEQGVPKGVSHSMQSNQEMRSPTSMRPHPGSLAGGHMRVQQAQWGRP